MLFALIQAPDLEGTVAARGGGGGGEGRSVGCPGPCLPSVTGQVNRRVQRVLHEVNDLAPGQRSGTSADIDGRVRRVLEASSKTLRDGRLTS